VSAAIVNRITTWVVIGPWLLWLAWEIALIWLRGSGTHVYTISQEAKRLAFGYLGSLAYFWGGMTAHYFLTWSKPSWSSPLPAVAFWVIGLAYMGADFFDGGDPSKWPNFVQWLRWPPVVVVIGLLAGHLLFPQPTPWRPE
jgi:hypothetical protein